MSDRVDLGWVDTELEEEFPDLRVVSIGLQASSGKTSRDVKKRLNECSNRLTGAKAIRMRAEPVPSAYRVFFRLIGLDPDRERTPIESAALTRLMSGAFDARDRIGNALLLGLVETGVPLFAVDEATLDGPLGLRPARDGERLGEGELANDLPPGRLVVADSAGPVAVLFGDVSPARAIGPATMRIRVAAIGVSGVPQIHVEEALWACAEALH